MKNNLPNIDSPYQIDSNKINFFWNNGYVILKNVLSRDEIKIYRKEGYENDYGNNVVEVCHEKTKPTQEFDIFENMDAYVRDVIILGYVLINENFPNE